MSRILLLGCGVAGLTTAARLLEGGHRVRIVARDLPPATTSDVAAAFWHPYKALPRDRVTEWAGATLAAFRRLAAQGAPGVEFRQALELFREPVGDPWWAAAVPGLRRATRAELPPGYADGYVFEAPVVDPRRYLPHLMEWVTAGGGTIERRAVTSLDDAGAADEIVVNCTGLGSRELVGDTELVPVRGEVVWVENPGLERTILDELAPDGVAYVIPRGADCVLGGTATAGDERLTSDPADVRGILERCRRLVPRLQTARRIGGRVGLRPARSAVRLETESGRRGQLVVHNYGHGGAGVTLSWGCAEEVARLLRRR